MQAPRGKYIHDSLETSQAAIISVMETSSDKNLANNVAAHFNNIGIWFLRIAEDWSRFVEHEAAKKKRGGLNQDFIVDIEVSWEDDFLGEYGRQTST